MNEPKIYLNSFYPLSCNTKGKKAIRQFGLPKYIDGSCRREPDFESQFPCITALCRPKFSQKLKKGDIVIYVTNKKGIGSRKIIAVLEVINIFENHENAANWYKENNLPIPNNLIVDETIPFELEKTHQKMGWEACIAQANSLEKWNEGYKNRAKKHPKVAQCQFLYCELNNPLNLTKINTHRSLTAQNPPILRIEEWNSVKDILGIKNIE